MERISRIFSSGRVPHSFLITGSSGADKAAFADRLARALVCESSAPPCGACRACTLAEHPDIIRVDAALKTEDARRLVSDTHVLPNDAQRKVYLITDAEKLSRYAQNVFLATLETPPKHVCFILTAAHASDLLPTVVSRCTQIKFSGASASLSEVDAALSILTPLSQKDELGVLAACVALEKYKRDELREVLESMRTLLRDGALSSLSPILAEGTPPAFTYAEFLACTDALNLAANGIARNLGVPIILGGLAVRLIRAVTAEEEL